MKSAALVRRLSRTIFERLGVEKDFTHYDPSDYGYVTYNGEGYAIRGGNHLSGTHIMGSAPSNSVVDAEQRSWDHRNLYMVGPGSMCSIGSCNITLTTPCLSLQSSPGVIPPLTRFSSLPSMQTSSHTPAHP